MVDAVAGTTVDPVDSLVEIGGEMWRFVDTAGLRRRVDQASGAEYYASLRTAAAIEAAEVAVVLLDASEPISEQDQRVISVVIEAGRALVIAFNKWDLVDEDRRERWTRRSTGSCVRVPWAPRVNISALTGRGVDRLAPALRTALESWERAGADRAAQQLAGRARSRRRRRRCAAASSRGCCSRPRPAPGRRRFVLFTTGFLEPAYRRFVERRLREDFGFPGSPVEVVGPGTGEAQVGAPWRLCLGPRETFVRSPILERASRRARTPAMRHAGMGEALCGRLGAAPERVRSGRGAAW